MSATEDLLDARKKLIFKPYSFGLLGSLTLLGLYVLVLTVSNSFEHALTQFLLFWPWFSLLILGFGVQVGLFFYMTSYHKVTHCMAAGKKTVMATAGISGGAMVVCCLHHVTDILPILGLSALSVFFSEYQVLFLAIGISSNVIGIAFMLSMLQRHDMVLPNSIFRSLFWIRWNLIFYASILLAIFALAYLFKEIVTY